nr:MAG TPA: hypothetical protein [Caudoviricetes sp.]
MISNISSHIFLMVDGYYELSYFSLLVAGEIYD